MISGKIKFFQCFVCILEKCSGKYSTLCVWSNVKQKKKKKTHTQNHWNPAKMGTTSASHPNLPWNSPRNPPHNLPRNPPLLATQTHRETHSNANKNPWVTAWWERFAKPKQHCESRSARENEISARGVLRCEIGTGVGGFCLRSVRVGGGGDGSSRSASRGGLLFEIGTRGGYCSRSVLGAAMRDRQGGGEWCCARKREREQESGVRGCNILENGLRKKIS